MIPETQAPHWEWYYIAMYFYIGGISAGAYFIGSLLEFFGNKRYYELSRTAYIIAFPLICITPILLIADLGRPVRFWHLFFYTKAGIPYMNLTSPLSVGTWALLIYSGMSFFSYLNAQAAGGPLAFPLLEKVHSIARRIPHRLYALTGSFFGFFVAGYTGVLVNTTARPLWAATDPLFGPIFIASAASTGAAAIALAMLRRKTAADEAFSQLGSFDRIAMILELLLIIAMLLVARQYTAPLMKGVYAVLFWGGAVVLGILAPLGLHWYGRKPGEPATSIVTMAALLVLFGGAMLRISLVQAGQL